MMAPSGLKQRILVIVDELSVYELIAQALEGKAHDLVWSQTACEGLRRLFAESFDLVLLDFDLSNIAPGEILDWFRTLHPFMPVIMLTGRPDQLERAAALDPDGCLSKPLDATRVLRMVEGLLEGSHQARRSRLVGSLYYLLRGSAP